MCNEHKLGERRNAEFWKTHQTREPLQEKKLWGGLILGKREGRSGGIPDLQTSLNIFYSWSQELRVGAVGFHCTGVVPWMPLHLQKIPLKILCLLRSQPEQDSVDLSLISSVFPTLIHSLHC